MKYFSKLERNSFLIVACSFGAIKEWIEAKQTCLNANDKRALKRATETVQRVLKNITDDLSEDYLKKIVTDIKNNEIAVIPKRTIDSDDETRLKTETLETIAEFALWRYQSDENKSTCNDFGKCELYRALTEAGIPVASLNTDSCPYRL